MAEGDAAKRAFDEYLRRRADGEPVDIDVFCAERPHLAAGLRLLHSLHAAGSTASADGAPDDGANDTAAALEVLSPGDRVGHYLILRKLGGGGMGDVYLAEQQRPVQRQVALKIIKLGMDTREVIARFDAERQALALMDHPGIARIFDAGATVTGRPFFAMEFVDGAPITTFCDRERLDVATRLRLFLQVCRAVQHAHSKGILHRDLKPTNVLVSPVDGEPTARVIDFGIAKATDRRLTERTLATELGTAVGTPAYMSPEQTRLSSEVDARSDVYSLGVILYELLIGDLPLDWTSPQAAGLEEVLHRIREEDPPTPSTRWLRLDAGETRARAARRGIDSPHLLRELRGDLDWITMRALEKEPDRRYATAADLAADIERFLDGEPVAARPPSAIYRAQKFIRRYRVAVTAVAAVIAALVAGLVASLLLYVEAEDRLARALQQTYLANITAAGDRLEESNSAEARRRLAACPESLRGWEWRHLDLKRDTSLARLSDGGDSLAVAVGPDGRIAATGNDRGTVRIWNAIDGTSLRTVECGPANVDSIHISSDGERIIAGFSDGSVRTWRADPWTPLAVIKTTASSAWSADASRVASGTDDGRIDVRDTGTGALILSAQAHTDRVSTVALDADGRSVVFASVDRTVRVLDVETGEIVVLAGHVGAITALDVTPAGDRVASASADRTVRYTVQTSPPLPKVRPGFANTLTVNSCSSSDGRNDGSIGSRFSRSAAG